MSNSGTPGPRGIGPKYCSIHCVRLGGIEVADDHERGVVGRVVGVEELLHVLQRGRVEIRQVAVEVVRVVPVVIRQLRHVEPREAAVGLVQDVHLDLVLDHALLVDEVVLR